jgi:hypothetical protein
VLGKAKCSGIARRVRRSEEIEHAEALGDPGGVVAISHSFPRAVSTLKGSQASGRMSAGSWSRP